MSKDPINTTLNKRGLKIAALLARAEYFQRSLRYAWGIRHITQLS